MPDVDILQQESSKVQPSEELRLGLTIRALRNERGYTLGETSRRSGVSKSALSKIENERVSPTFELLERIAAGLDVPIVHLFTERPDQTERLALTKAGLGSRTEDGNYVHEFLCTSLKHRRMVPFITTVKARSAHQFKKAASHQGEEFLYVLCGEITFLSGSHDAVHMRVGDGLYFDSRLGHLCFSLGNMDARLLWIWCKTT